mmetsp:Transcript_32218/g.92719  ORF Transcript_32218/g.92719 Transcript_32218/m.92719 type:complete len:266 (+) Transcript_32218:626-1423(+)
MRPAACRPLLVVGKFHLNTLAKVLAEFLGVRQVRPVRGEAALGEHRAEGPGVRAPRDALLHHGRELHTAILPGLRSEVLSEANGVCHLLISEIKQLPCRGRRARRAPAARALPRASGLADPHSLSNGNIVAHCHSLEDLYPAALQLRPQCQGHRHQDSTWMSLRTAMAIVHVKEGTRVRIQKYGPFEVKGLVGAPDLECTLTIDALERFNYSGNCLVRRSGQRTTKLVNDCTLGEMLSLWLLVCPLEVLDVLHDRAVRHSPFSEQ